MKQYGLPLDSRTKLTKTDWEFWSATLADNQADFETITNPIYDFLYITDQRLPLVDSYNTDDTPPNPAFRARPVVGGFFIKAISDPTIWKKWSAADTFKASGWADVPPPPVITAVIPTSENTAQSWKYTTSRPSDDWNMTNFDDSSWQTGVAPFGKSGSSGIKTLGTSWLTDDIWMRRQVTLPAGPFKDLQFLLLHDDDAEVYVNGVPAVIDGGANGRYQPFEIDPAALALLTPGATVTISAHIRQTGGDQSADLGLADVSAAK
ncbi:MAG: Glutaminase, partial [Capsulimonas sp.]|nr:Glutaminase [Capsulimonas sp.]